MGAISWMALVVNALILCFTSSSLTTDVVIPMMSEYNSVGSPLRPLPPSPQLINVTCAPGQYVTAATVSLRR